MLETSWVDVGAMSIQPTSVSSPAPLSSHLSKSITQDKASAATAKQTPNVQKMSDHTSTSLTQQAADFSAGSEGASGHIDGYA